MTDIRRSLGDAGEAVAAGILERSGLCVVARNARTRYGEIDLVCRDGRGYVFVEVKTRRVGSFVAPAEALDRRKAARLTRLAQSWLAAKGRRAASFRVVLAAVTVSEAGPTVAFIDVD
ncbi:MAG: YraN family protein [Chloroflexota bacterium]|nr:YraN family protein [Chloroflexota bacterium]